MNSRVKDLVDMLLLVQIDELDRSRLKVAIEETFKRRKAHFIPREFPDVPPEWEKPFQHLAKEVGLDLDLVGGVNRVRQLFQKIS